MMNIQDFDFIKDLPRCDICGTIATSVSLGRDKSSMHPIVCEIQFGCMATWLSETSADFNAPRPDGNLTIYGIQGPFKQVLGCGDAVRIVRELRGVNTDKDGES